MNAIGKRFYDAMIGIAKGGFIAQCIYHKIKVDMKLSLPENDNEECLFMDSKTSSFSDDLLQYEFTDNLILSPQAKINNGFVVDFLLESTYPAITLAIEIDGHEWHEKTKEQASRDKERSRSLLRQGFPEIRFTGSEVFTRPDDCAKESVNTFLSIYTRTLCACPESFYAHIFRRSENV